jgi:hypothetical protein
MQVYVRHFASNGEMNQLICMLGMPCFNTLQGDTCTEVWSTSSRFPGALFRLILTSFSVRYDVSKIRDYIYGTYRTKIDINLKEIALRGKIEDLIILVLHNDFVRRKIVKHEYNYLRSK